MKKYILLLLFLLFTSYTNAQIQATGGSYSTYGGYSVRTFTAGDTFTVTAGSGYIDIFIVGGGAGGGDANATIKGGGQGGRITTVNGLGASSGNSWSVTIGGGGAARYSTSGQYGGPGGTSYFGGYSAVGGVGSTDIYGTCPNTYYGGPGRGGYSTSYGGCNGIAGDTNWWGTYYSGGGGGGAESTYGLGAGTGGTGGGGNGGYNSAGTNASYYGGGGGGAGTGPGGYYTSGTGYQGIVIVRYIELTAPDTPTLSSPANGATGVSINPTLYWNSSARATSYTYAVYSDAGLTSVVQTGNVGGNTSWAISTLSYSTTYYWRVYASNAAGNSGWSSARSFTTQAIPVPGTPTLSSPSNGATEQTPNLSLSWGAVTYATGYHLQVSTNSDCSGPLYDSNTGSTSVSGGGWSSYSTTYYWRVYAYNGSGNSSYSAIRSFTTNMLPLTPTIQAAGSITTTTFRANWSVASYATNYKIDIGTSAGGTDIVNNATTGNVIYYDASGLTGGTTYYYRVRSTNAYGTSGNSGNQSVLTIPPAVTLNTPSDVATGIILNNNVIWNSATSATSYYLQVSTTSDCTSGFKVDGNVGNVTSYASATDAYSTTYYWRVAGVNASGTGTYSSIRSFTTMAAVISNKQGIKFSANGVTSKYKIMGSKSGIK